MRCVTLSMGIFFKYLNLNRFSCQVTSVCVQKAVYVYIVIFWLVFVRIITFFFDNVFTEKLSSSIQPITFFFSFDIVCGRSQLCEKTNDKIPVFVILKNYVSTCTFCLSNDSIEGKYYLPIFQFHITLKHVHRYISLLKQTQLTKRVKS